MLYEVSNVQKPIFLTFFAKKKPWLFSLEIPGEILIPSWKIQIKDIFLFVIEVLVTWFYLFFDKMPMHFFYIIYRIEMISLKIKLHAS